MALLSPLFLEITKRKRKGRVLALNACIFLLPMSYEFRDPSTRTYEQYKDSHGQAMLRSAGARRLRKTLRRCPAGEK